LNFKSRKLSRNEEEITLKGEKMSENYLIIIPELPDFVPEKSKQLQASLYFQSIESPGTKIEVSVYKRVRYFHCGGNFEYIKCPFCETDIDIETWQNWMDIDFDGEGFILNSYKLPCCGNSCALNELKYHFPQGFARFQLKALDYSIGQFSPDQLEKFTQILGCKIHVIYQHI
jgi:hypothetical protein